MDIRSAQKIAWDAGLANSLQTNNASLEFSLLSDEVAKAIQAWATDSRAMTEELAAIAIFLFRLAQLVGTDLQEVVEEKLAVSKSKFYGHPSNEVRVKDGHADAKTTIRHGKLVRDKIPQIIRSKGQEPIIHTADAEEYYSRLRDKLREEVEEYLASDNDREELADILEVLYALASQAGTDQHELEKLRAAKAEKRGGFADRIIWFHNKHAAAAQDLRIAATRL
jgi:predicted house-cleaning noncanonical NTP pyrophosphatase (MazG superfamily)